MASPDISLSKAVEPSLDRFERLSPLDQIVLAAKVNDVLLAAQSRVAGIRRGAIRTMRASGYTLSEIAKQTGMTPQRVHQLEIGHDRRDK